MLVFFVGTDKYTENVVSVLRNILLNGQAMLLHIIVL